jgi:putative ABC transport system permease protein
MDPNLPIPAIRTMRDIVSASVAQRRFQMVLTSLFAFVALLLGAVGVYGVVSYSVACRTRDIGLPTDPLSLGGVALVLLVTSGLACYLPARRAARLDPMTALRHE